MLWAIISFFISVTFSAPASAATQTTATPNPKPFFAVSEADIKTAHCLKVGTPTDQEMTEWLVSRERTNGRVGAPNLTDESPFLVNLLQQLLTVDSMGGSAAANL